ncbi:MAG: 50S ribosomal protein L6 [Candidatus Omnitrophica bacterium]|nr:50S ribosomal protein L6 [Candidatus Omnitrophota bacterium]
MSRLGKKPINIPNNVKASLSGDTLVIEGPKGRLDYTIPQPIKVAIEGGKVVVTRPSDSKKHMSLHGLVRTLINNMMIGVTEGYKKELEIRGVGYKAKAEGSNLTLNLGFSHAISYPIPENVTIETPKPTIIIIRSTDKVKAGEVAAELREFYKPEPYKGKGVRYAGEYVRHKAGKTVA